MNGLIGADDPPIIDQCGSAPQAKACPIRKSTGAPLGKGFDEIPNYNVTNYDGISASSECKQVKASASPPSKRMGSRYRTSPVNELHQRRFA